jgi:hypothetical protein
VVAAGVGGYELPSAADLVVVRRLDLEDLDR